jgi:predicted lipoprotein with Yx(FWY)xxD motif
MKDTTPGAHRPGRPRRPPRARGGAYGTAVAALGLGMVLAMTAGPVSAGPVSAGPVSAGPAAAGARLPAEIGDKVVVKTATVHKYGKVLVTKKGLALYYNKDDKSSRWACTGACLRTWPPLTIPKGETIAQLSNGVSGLGTVPGLTGRQVTWDGKALYTFSQDTPGTVKGEGIAQIWYVVQLSHTPAPATRGGHGGAPATTTTTAGNWG